jgi:RNA polymerase sigma factor for flagellar operon FliA
LTPTAFSDVPELVKQHSPLVRRIAAQIGSRLPSHIALDDLVQEGMMGLLDAISRFQPKANLSFEHYASMRIRGAIYDACRRNDVMPRHRRDKLDRLQMVTQQLENRLGRTAKDLEIAVALEIPLSEYHALLDSMVGLTPIDDLPEGLMPEDPAANPSEHIAQVQLMERLTLLLKGLPEKQQLILALHYQQELSYSEISDVVGLTRGRISQIHTQAMLAIRRGLGIDPAQPDITP